MQRSRIASNSFLVALTAFALVACSKPAEAPKEEAKPEPARQPQYGERLQPERVYAQA